MRENTKAILLRLTAEEYAHLKATAETAGLKVEPTIRKLITGTMKKPSSSIMMK